MQPDLNAVAIDGPAGAGKSVVARAVAERFGFLYVDTGAMYRAVALAALRAGIEMEDPQAMGKIARACKLSFDASGTRIRLDGEDVSEAIRTPELTRLVKYAAVSAPVREELVRQQQNLARERPVVMEGRDITTVVLPGARYKFYLDASVKCRARRRQKDLAAAGEEMSLEDLMADIEARDRSDRERATGPLKRTPEQVYLDTSEMTRQEVVDWIVKYIETTGGDSLPAKPEPESINLVYRFCRAGLRLCYRLFWRWKCFGAERLPPSGPVLIACNHASYLDPSIVGSIFERPVGFMARKSLFTQNRWFTWLIKKGYAFPLDRDGDPRSAIRAISARLREGRCVVMFPEGTRTSNGRLGKIRRGLGMISVRNLAPVLPVYIGGSFESWPRGAKIFRFYPLRIEVGEPVYPRDCGGDRKLMKAEENRIQEEVAGQLKRLEAKYFEYRKNPEVLEPGGE